MSEEQQPRFPLAIPVLWFETAGLRSKGIVVHPETGDVTTIDADFVPANHPYPASWCIDGRAYCGERPRVRIVSVSKRTLDSLRNQNCLCDNVGGCPTVKDASVAAVDSIPGPLPRWA